MTSQRLLRLALLRLGSLLAFVGTVGCGGGDGANDGGPGGESSGTPSTIGGSQHINGLPAPGATCNISEDGGYAPGEYLAETEFIRCDGTPITMSEVFCGSPVGWTYYFLGAG